MAENQNYIEFITRLIEETKDKKIQWKYLDQNHELYSTMGWTKFSLIKASAPDFNVDDSYYAKIDNTYIVLLTNVGEEESNYGREITKLYVVPNTYRKSLKIPEDEYGDSIIRLFNMVQSQFPDAQKFIVSFLGKTKK